MTRHNILEKRNIDGRRAFSLLELLIVATAIIVVAGGAFTLFRGTVKMSEKGTQMMDQFQRAQRIVLRLARDIREANYAKPEAPIIVDADKIATVENSPESHKIEIIKQKPDFSTPATGASKHLNYTEESVIYQVEQMQGSQKFKLLRKEGARDELVADNIEQLTFYRVAHETTVNGQNVLGTGDKTIYIVLKMTVPNIRGDATGYKIDYTTAVTMRGTLLN